MKEVVLTIIFGFSIKFCTHSCTKFESAKNFSEGFFLLAVNHFVLSKFIQAKIFAIQKRFKKSPNQDQKSIEIKK